MVNVHTLQVLYWTKRFRRGIILGSIAIVIDVVITIIIIRLTVILIIIVMINIRIIDVVIFLLLLLTTCDITNHSNTIIVLIFMGNLTLININNIFTILILIVVVIVVENTIFNIIFIIIIILSINIALRRCDRIIKQQCVRLNSAPTPESKMSRKIWVSTSNTLVPRHTRKRFDERVDWIIR